MKGKHNLDVKSGYKYKNKLRFRKMNDIIRMVKKHKYKFFIRNAYLVILIYFIKNICLLRYSVGKGK